MVLRVEQTIKDGKAITQSRQGILDGLHETMILLSSPALNMKYGVAKHLTDDEKQQHIEGMYRKLFHSCQYEGVKYIAMPAAGLGVFGGDPVMYFNALSTVAREFSSRGIIYHPGHPNNSYIFDRVIRSQQVDNIVKAKKM